MTKDARKSEIYLKELAAETDDTTEAQAVDQLLHQMETLKQQVAEQEALIQSLKNDARSDPLTGLVNRRVLESEPERAVASAQRYGRCHALLLLDIDSFKSINDNLGHVAGDEVLKHVAKLLAQNTRQTDVVARLGGDEFCIILNELKDKETAYKRAEKLNQIIHNTPCMVGNRSLNVHVSAGCYVFGAEDKSIMDILEKADKSMYEQKHEGR